MIKGYINKKELLKEIKKYDLHITDRILAHYFNLGLYERPSIDLYKEDTAKILYVIDKLKKLGSKRKLRLKLKEIKFYLDLLKLGKKEFDQIQKLIQEGEFLDSYKEYIGITEKRLEELKRLYPVMYCEILISRYFIFEHCLEYRAEIEIFDEVEKLKEGKTKEEKLKIDSIVDNPGDPEIDLEKEKITVRFDKPLDLKVIFKENSIKIVK